MVAEPYGGQSGERDGNGFECWFARCGWGWVHKRIGVDLGPRVALGAYSNFGYCCIGGLRFALRRPPKVALDLRTPHQHLLFNYLNLNTIKQTPENLVPGMIPIAALITPSREIA